MVIAPFFFQAGVGGGSLIRADFAEKVYRASGFVVYLSQNMGFSAFPLKIYDSSVYVYAYQPSLGVGVEFPELLSKKVTLDLYFKGELNFITAKGISAYYPAFQLETLFLIEKGRLKNFYLMLCMIALLNDIGIDFGFGYRFLRW